MMNNFMDTSNNNLSPEDDSVQDTTDTKLNMINENIENLRAQNNLMEKKLDSLLKLLEKLGG